MSEEAKPRKAAKKAEAAPEPEVVEEVAEAPRSVFWTPSHHDLNPAFA